MAKKPKISCVSDGPLFIEGVDSLIGAEGKRIELSGGSCLCRCGESKNKPLCDGSHEVAGFSDQKSDERTPDRREDFVGDDIVIHDNRGICAHAGICTDSLKSVFRIDNSPFVDPKGASKDEIIEVIEKCPSGALSYSLKGEEQVFSSDEVSVYVAPNGPYAVKGKVELEDANWCEGACKEKYDLCRCGDSKNKPFCDGSHWRKHFDEDAPDPTK